MLSCVICFAVGVQRARLPVHMTEEPAANRQNMQIIRRSLHALVEVIESFPLSTHRACRFHCVRYEQHGRGPARGQGKLLHMYGTCV